MFIDTHCHPYYRKNLSEKDVFGNFKEEGGEFMVSIGVDLETSKTSVELTNKYDFVYASIGIQPIDGVKNQDLITAINELELLYLDNKDKVVGIGECGLDYHWVKSEDLELEKEKQKKFFIAQIGFAEKYSLPFIIHNRDAKDDTFEILKQMGYGNFIMHCFSEDLEYAKKLIKHFPSCMISFSGIVTFKNAIPIQEVAKKIPLRNILIETDSPYLTPAPYRGKEENRPSYTKYVLEKIIELRDEAPETIEKQLLENSKRIFNLN